MCVCVCFFRGHNSVQGNSQYKVLQLGDLIFEAFFFGISSSRDGSCLLSLSLFFTQVFFFSANCNCFFATPGTHMKGLEGIRCQRSARLVGVLSVFFSALYVYFLGFVLPTSLSLLFPSLLGLCFPSGFWSFFWFFSPRVRSVCSVRSRVLIHSWQASTCKMLML